MGDDFFNLPRKLSINFNFMLHGTKILIIIITFIWNSRVIKLKNLTRVKNINMT